MAPIGAADSSELAREIMAVALTWSAGATAADTPETRALTTLLVTLGHLAASAQQWLEHLSVDRLAMTADGTWQASGIEVRLR
jgi:hypothetical protein